MAYTKASLLDDFEIPEITHETIKNQLKKVNKVHNVVKKSNFANLPLLEKLKIIEKEVYKTLGRYKGFVKVIYGAEELEKYIDKAIQVEYLTLDTETNNSLDPITCKIMGLCLYIPNTKPVYVPMNHCYPGTENRLPNQVNEEEAARILKKAADKGTKFVYHNGKFDIRVCKNTLGFYLPIYWDTMLAAQVLDENERAGLKPQYKNHIDPTIGTYNIEKLFAGIPYAWVAPEVFALYAAIDSYDTWKLMKFQQKLFEEPGMDRLLKLLTTVEFPVTLVVAKMEDDGIAFDEEFATRLDNKFKAGLEKATADMDEILKPHQNRIDIYQSNGKLDNPINFNSAPQLQIVLYDILGIVNPDGERGTDKDTLKALKHPFTEALLDYRHFNKMITSFTSTLPGLRSSKDNKIHAHFNQMGKEENNVRTGRFSSTDPNLQQIPSREKVMRMMFQASPGYVIVGGDYSQQEPRVLTHMCRDPKLIETYNNNKDLYAVIASMVFKKDYWECMEHWEDGSPNPEGKATRSKCKGLVLGVMYGMGAKLMSTMMGITLDECVKILEEFFKMFPTIKKYTEGNEIHAREYGYVEDYMGRRRHLPDINLPQLRIEAKKKVDLDSEYFDDYLKDDKGRWLDKLFIYDDEETKYWENKYAEYMGQKYNYNVKAKFKEEAKAAGVDVFDNGAFISKATTQCTNATIQGSAATLTKKAMVKIFNDQRLRDIDFKLLIPVHDELLGEVKAEYAELAEKYLTEDMIEAAKPECSVNMKVDTYVVKHWYTDEVANGIEDTYKQYVNGNPKKNIEPISREEAIEKLCHKYSELSRDTVILMCDGKFDHINGTL